MKINFEISRTHLFRDILKAVRKFETRSHSQFRVNRAKVLSRPVWLKCERRERK